MIDIREYFWIALVLIILGQALSVIISSKRFWAATDYLWYALAAISVGLFVADFNNRLKQESISVQLSEVENQATAISTYFEQIKASSVCQIPVSSCNQISTVLEDLSKFQESADWPFGGFEDNLETDYSSLPAYLEHVITELSEDSPSIVQDLPQRTATLITSMAELELLQARNTWTVHVLILRFAVYLFAVGIALKIGKVTWTLRQRD